MPVVPQVKYPGVYVQEVPSGVRTITGVSTSITAFIGRALRGRTDEAVTINSFSDFTRIFGGLAADYPMSYAVNDFYNNGGNQVLIVRLHKDAHAATFTLSSVTLEAYSPGTWGNSLAIKVDYNDIDDDLAGIYGLAKTDLFNLTVVELTANGQVGQIEKFPNVSVLKSAGSRRLDRVLEQGSLLIRVQDPLAGWPDPAARPVETLPTADPTVLDNVINKTVTMFANGLDSDALASSADYDAAYPALDKADLVNLLCIPPDTRDSHTLPAVYQTAMRYCVGRRAMLIVDPPEDWKDANDITASKNAKLAALNLNGVQSRNAAVYFPRVIAPDPARNGQLDTFVPCGMVAGIMAATDATRGVWKAPAGLDAALQGVQSLKVKLTDAENGMLNPLGINCLRVFTDSGMVVWGARTLRGADQLADEYKYIPVRRTALYIEESLYRGLKWVVFEPNDEPLWAQIRLNVGAFMHNLFRQGAFQGTSPKDAYFVKCDKETTTQNDINLGIVNIWVGFAPLRPAEFVIIYLQQMAGQIQT